MCGQRKPPAKVGKEFAFSGLQHLCLAKRFFFFYGNNWDRKFKVEYGYLGGKLKVIELLLP